MKKEMNDLITKDSKKFFTKSIRSLILFSLVFPLMLKLLLDIPSIAIDYICNSYAPFYPSATTAGLVIIQIAAVLADILRAGFMGCVICILIYMIDKNAEKVHTYIALAITLICPAVISFLGIYMTEVCVSVGLSRQTVYEFDAQLSDIGKSAMLEWVLFIVVIVFAIFCQLLRKNRLSQKDDGERNDNGAFFPSGSLFGTVAIAIGVSGLISLTVKILETVTELKTYDVTSSFEGIVSYLVLPYLYLAISLFAMLCFAALMYRRLDKKWQKCRGEEQ